MTMVEKSTSTQALGKSGIDLWRKCSVNNLAEHFHRYVADEKMPGDQQFERLRFLSLNDQALTNLFFKQEPIGIQNQLTSLVINLALDENPSPLTAFTFSAQITATYYSGESVTEVFQSNNPDIAHHPVPPTFKGWLTKNWLEMDITLLDDVFAACEPSVPGAARPTHKPIQRLFGYRFGPNTNTHFFNFLNEHLGKIQNFYLHLGVDMNKFAHRDEYSFSPIFEVQLPKNLDDREVAKIFHHGLRGVTLGELAKLLVYPVYYDYSSPCPSSCNA